VGTFSTETRATLFQFIPRRSSSCWRLPYLNHPLHEDRNEHLRRTQERLSGFDKLGVVVVAFLGTVLGLMITMTSDTKLTPSLFVMFPGLAIGYIAFKLFGLATAVALTAVANGAIYGILLYSWDRLVNRISRRATDYARASTKKPKY
jgi:hypothetical protein